MCVFFEVFLNLFVSYNFNFKKITIHFEKKLLKRMNFTIAGALHIYFLKVILSLDISQKSETLK